MSRYSTQSFTVNGRSYTPPSRPVVALCLDGSADEYFDAALTRERMPHLQRLAVNGYRGLARGAMPSFTNVNNSSIVTGVPPRVHGIGGNYFFDRQSGLEVMMNSASFLRCPTIFPAAAKSGRKVAVVTAKEKLRDIFASGLIAAGGIAFSSEKASQAKLPTHGIEQVESLVGPTPEIYSGEASLYVLQAGVRLIETGRADFLYLSTTDFMQHKFVPEAPEALEFYEAIDRLLGYLQKLGAILGITADHGMNDKQKPDGSPHVIYLESELVERFGPGFRVILPITDPVRRPPRRPGILRGHPLPRRFAGVPARGSPLLSRAPVRHHRGLWRPGRGKTRTARGSHRRCRGHFGALCRVGPNPCLPRFKSRRFGPSLPRRTL